MSKKSWIWKVVIGIVIVGVLVAAGFWIYQLGYRSGVAAANAGEGYPRRSFTFFWNEDESDRKLLGGHHGMLSDEDDGFITPFNQRLYFQDRFLSSRTYFSPLWFLLKLAVFGVFIWLIYKAITLLIGGKGWQFSFTRIDEEEKGKKK
jgi:hypothetical protein